MNSKCLSKQLSLWLNPHATGKTKHFNWILTNCNINLFLLWCMKASNSRDYNFRIKDCPQSWHGSNKAIWLELNFHARGPEWDIFSAKPWLCFHQTALEVFHQKCFYASRRPLFQAKCLFMEFLMNVLCLLEGDTVFVVMNSVPHSTQIHPLQRKLYCKTNFESHLAEPQTQILIITSS